MCIFMTTKSAKQSFFYFKKNVREHFDETDLSLEHLRKTQSIISAKLDYVDLVEIKKHVEFEARLFVGLMNDQVWDTLEVQAKNKIRYEYLNNLVFLQVHADIFNDINKIKSYEQAIKQALNTTTISILHKDTWVDWINWLNAYRRMTQFARVTWKNIWLVAYHLKWLDQAEYSNAAGALDKAVDFYNAIGVGVYALRLAINLSSMLKHIIFPSAKAQNVNWKTRLLLQFDERALSILNETIKTIVNTLTNYAPFFQLTPLAPMFVLSLLVFDCLRFFYLMCKEKEHLHIERQILKQDMGGGQSCQISTLLLQQHAFLAIEMTCKWLFSLSAAFILLASVTAGLLVPMVLSPLCLTATVFGSVMYLSADQFGQLMRIRAEKQFDAQKEVLLNTKWNEFLGTFTRNFCIPMLLMGMVVTSWPATCLLTILWLSYEHIKRKIDAPLSDLEPAENASYFQGF